MTRHFVKGLMDAIAIVFFRSIEVIGSDNLDLTGPVIYVGNHNNQFVDAMIMNYSVPREHSYLIAAKSFKLRFIGFIARALRSIPVKRTQDTSKHGAGTVTLHDGCVVKGTGTNFTKLLESGDSLKVAGIVEPLRVQKVISDVELLICSHPSEKFSGALWKAYEKVNQHEMFSMVWRALAESRAIALFPEGGSHDRPDILPLKAGVCLMALGAMANYDFDQPIKIVPVGISYFNGHRFQSRAVVEFGEPVVVDKNLVDMYMTNKREACGTLLTQIDHALRKVVITADNYKTLKFVRLGRRLYFGRESRLELGTFLEVDRLLAQYWKESSSETRSGEAKLLISAMHLYADTLERFNFTDKDVAKMAHVSPSVAVELFLFRIVSGTGFVLAGVPGTLLVLPMGVIAKMVSLKKQRQAVQGSEVKLAGTDVIASWKILTCLTVSPIFCLLYPYILFQYVLGDYSLSVRLLATLLFAFLWPIYGVLSAKVLYYGLRTFKSLRYLRPVALNDHRRFRQLVDDRSALEKRLRVALDERYPEIREIREAGELRLSEDENRRSNPFKGGDSLTNALGKGTDTIASVVSNSFDQIKNLPSGLFEQIHNMTETHYSEEDLRMPNSKTHSRNTSRGNSLQNSKSSSMVDVTKSD